MLCSICLFLMMCVRVVTAPSLYNMCLCVFRSNVTPQSRLDLKLWSCHTLRKELLGSATIDLLDTLRTHDGKSKNITEKNIRIYFSTVFNKNKISNPTYKQYIIKHNNRQRKVWFYRFFFAGSVKYFQVKANSIFVKKQPDVAVAHPYRFLLELNCFFQNGVISKRISLLSSWHQWFARDDWRWLSNMINL